MIIYKISIEQNNQFFEYYKQQINNKLESNIV